MADGVVYTGFDPAFGDKLNQLIALAKARGYSPDLISGRRDAYGWPGMKGQSQADLYSQLGKPGGPKAAAPPGYSPHQYGLAGDVAGLPQSVLEQLASEVGLRAIHSDPNHLELPNWQQTAATQPQMTAWDQSNPANVPSQYAMNMEATAPSSTAPPGTTLNSNIIDMLSRNIAGIESGGQKNPYEALNPTSHAIGKYQVMPSNVAGWTQAALGQSMTPDEFRANPSAQEAVFRDQMQRNLQLYGPKDAASIWFTGRPYNVAGGAASDANKTTNASYVARATAGLNDSGTFQPGPAVAAASGAPTTPAGGPAAPAAPGQPAYAPGSPAAKLQALGKAGQGLEKAAGADSGGDQPPDFKLAPIQPAQPVGGAMMMGAGGQNAFAQRAAQQGLAQQGFMLQPSLAAFGAYNPPSPIGAPSPGGAMPGSAQGMPAMPGTTLNSPSALQMALMSGSINPYDLYARAGMGAGGFGST